MKLRFTQRSTQDLAEIADYIRARNPRAASRSGRVAWQFVQEVAGRMGVEVRN